MRIIRHQIDSPYQSTETTITIGLPTRDAGDEPLSCIYVLPVDRLDGQSCGDPIAQVSEYLDQHPRPFLCAMPSFTHAPWLADHPTDPGAKQEQHFLRVVLPFVEENYPVRPSASGRLLLGFSKSGWGAYSLLLRNVDTFGKAAAWDAPFGQASPNKYGMAEIFADQETLDRYDVWTLLKEKAQQLGNETRLGLFGYGSFRGHVQATHYHMRKLKIPHVYADGPQRSHDWESGWVPAALDFLTAV